MKKSILPALAIIFGLCLTTTLIHAEDYSGVAKGKSKSFERKTSGGWITTTIIKTKINKDGTVTTKKKTVIKKEKK